jgi:transcription elongation GreA/GreB family factor
MRLTAISPGDVLYFAVGAAHAPGRPREWETVTVLDVDADEGWVRVRAPAGERLIRRREAETRLRTSYHLNKYVEAAERKRRTRGGSDHV